MIKYVLKCRGGHEFESWFASASSFDAQAAQGHITCPACHTADVHKAIMAPSLTTHGRDDIGQKAEVVLHDGKQNQLQAGIRSLRSHIFAETEDVGARFPQEARRIADGVAADRPIRGQASFEEAGKLLDDGIRILPVPLLPEDLN
jgi:hypothetical protein